MNILIEEQSKFKDQLGPCMEFFLNNEMLRSITYIAKLKNPRNATKVVIQLVCNLLIALPNALFAQMRIYRPVLQILQIGKKEYSVLNDLVKILIRKIHDYPEFFQIFVIGPNSQGKQKFVIMDTVESIYSNTSMRVYSRSTIIMIAKIDDPLISTCVENSPMLHKMIVRDLIYKFDNLPAIIIDEFNFGPYISQLNFINTLIICEAFKSPLLLYFRLEFVEQCLIPRLQSDNFITVITTLSYLNETLNILDTKSPVAELLITCIVSESYKFNNSFEDPIIPFIFKKLDTYSNDNNINDYMVTILFKLCRTVLENEEVAWMNLIIQDVRKVYEEDYVPISRYEQMALYEIIPSYMEFYIMQVNKKWKTVENHEEFFPEVSQMNVILENMMHSFRNFFDNTFHKNVELTGLYTTLSLYNDINLHHSIRVYFFDIINQLAEKTHSNLQGITSAQINEKKAELQENINSNCVDLVTNTVIFKEFYSSISALYLAVDTRMKEE
eukprot:TRINITY_DN5207_c0_g1_i3.p1 TRINITY_DN5207_c0_g1~~TRINITY_DN5207_c0_g1_i3.p1  ORF type:complete len:499 (+),score=79.90 TRINITY_DN5207_c0_g1_i3:223-1719(+)